MHAPQPSHAANERPALPKSIVPSTPASRQTHAPFRPRPDVELCERGELRTERFLDAAMDAFIEKGYRRASLGEIVRQAGGSMSTLYRAFGDKEGLAHAIIERHMATVTARLQDLSLSGLPPESALALVGESILDASISRESLLVHRIVIGEGRDFPELRDWFFAQIGMPSQAILTEYLEGDIAAGLPALRQPANASRQFILMIFGAPITRVASGT